MAFGAVLYYPSTFPKPDEYRKAEIQSACPAIITARFPITSTAHGFSIRMGHRRKADAIFCAGSSIAIGVATRRNGRPGRRRPMPTVRRHASRVRLAHFLCRPCQPAHPDRGPQYAARPGLVAARVAFRFVGPKRVNDPGIAFADLPPIDVVLVSHGHYDHLDLATLSRIAAAHRARVVTPLGNDAIMRNHDPKIAAEGLRLGRPGRAGRRLGGDARRRPSIGRRAACPTATRCCGRRS